MHVTRGTTALEKIYLIATIVCILYVCLRGVFYAIGIISHPGLSTGFLFTLFVIDPINLYVFRAAALIMALPDSWRIVTRFPRLREHWEIYLRLAFYLLVSIVSHILYMNSPSSV